MNGTQNGDGRRSGEQAGNWIAAARNRLNSVKLRLRRPALPAAHDDDRPYPPPASAAPASHVALLPPPPAPEPTAPLDVPALPAATGRPALVVYSLGSFRVYQGDRLLDKWPGAKGRSIFKYVIAHRPAPVHREVLMDRFWPDAGPEAARRNLHQAVYNLRRALQNGCPECSYFLFEEGFYHLDPAVDIWVDSEAFMERYGAGQRLEREGCLPEAMAEYEAAATLYGGQYMADDLYEDWLVVQREHFKLAYLDVLDRLARTYYEREQWAMCIAVCQKILVEDNCREDAYRRLMRCYYRQGHRHLAIRQYHICVETLRRELDVAPMPATEELYRHIQKNGNQPPDPRKLRKK